MKTFKALFLRARHTMSYIPTESQKYWCNANQVQTTFVLLLLYQHVHFALVVHLLCHKGRSEATCGLWNFLWKQVLFFSQDPNESCPSFAAAQPWIIEEKFSPKWCKCKLSITRIVLFDSKSILGFCNPWSGQLTEVNRSFALASGRKMEPTSH